MKSYRFVVVFLTVAYLLGCAGSHQKINNLKIGMTKQEVIEAIGDPDTTSASGKVEYLKYRIKVGLVYSDQYLVRLLNGKVDAYGQKGDFNLPY